MDVMDLASLAPHVGRSHAGLSGETAQTTTVSKSQQQMKTCNMRLHLCWPRFSRTPDNERPRCIEEHLRSLVIFFLADRIRPMRQEEKQDEETTLCTRLRHVTPVGLVRMRAGDEARPTSQPTQATDGVPQKQTDAINGVTTTPGGTASSSVPPGTM
jgi:hypothetical protein